MKPIDRFLLLAVVGVCIFGALAIRNLDQDDQLINRGQSVTNCIGVRADLIDDWRAVFLGYQTQLQQEFITQVKRVQDGRLVTIGRGEALAVLSAAAERNIRLLVEEKRTIRATSEHLIAKGSSDFTCPLVADDLMPPPLPD